MSETTTALFIGIDVSKDRLDVAVYPGDRVWNYPNQTQSFPALVAESQSLQPELVVMEATGALETAIAAALAAAGLPLAIVNPRQVCDFAKAKGQLAKTDRIDAKVLAHFASAIRAAPQILPSAEQQHLGALMARRRQVVEMLVAERNRLHTALPTVQERIQTHIAWLETELDDLELELQRTVEQSPVWRTTEDLLQSVPGVGPITTLYSRVIHG